MPDLQSGIESQHEIPWKTLPDCKSGTPLAIFYETFRSTEFTKKDRYVIASKKFIKDAMQYLESRKDNNPYMFISDHNKEQHITIRTAEEIVKKSAKSANIRRRVFPHALRSTFATHLYQNGVDAFSLQKLLGHARIETTRGYTKTDFRMINSITSPLDLD